MFATDLENPWIAAVRQAPRRAPAAIIAAVGLVIPGALLFGSRGAVWNGPEGLSNLVVFACLAVAAVIGALLEGRRLWPRETYGLAAVIGGLALGLGSVLACVAVASIAGAPGVITAPSGVPVEGLIAAILVAALGAAAQEVFFRGWLQPTLCAGWGAWFGILFTAAAFVAFHVAAGPQGVLGSVNLLLTGLLLGLLALRSGGLAAPVAAHVIWAWCSFTGVGLSAPGPIVEVQLRGPALWSGGDQGLGGSLAATLVLAALLVSLLTVKAHLIAPPTASRETTL